MVEFTEQELVDHVEQICFHIGERPPGSDAYHKAAYYIASVFRSAGLEVEEQTFPCVDWAEELTTLQVDSRVLDAAANAFSPPCDITAPTVAVCTEAELEAADLEGKIAVLYGDLTQEALLPKCYRVYRVEKHERIIAQLEAKQPLAVLTISAKGMERRIEDRDFAIPSASVSINTGRFLIDHEGKPTHLHIESHRRDSTGANIVGRMGDLTKPRIVLCAHYDTKHGTPGALDNGGGVAALLELSMLLSRRALSVGLEFVAFGDEDSYSDGDFEYARLRENTYDNILALINLDGVGGKAAANTATTVAASDALTKLVRSTLANYRGMVWAEPWIESDHGFFAWRGIPCIALTSTGIFALNHLEDDTMDGLSTHKLAEAVAFVTDVVDSLQDKGVGWARAE